jgi:hypothetical protein
MSREAMQMALEALLNFPDDISDDMFESITALKAALAQPEQDTSAYHGWVLREVLFDNGEPVGHREPEQEPVAHIDHRIHGWPDCFVIRADPPHTSPLYLSLPKREWVGLTDEEIYDCEEEVGMPQYEISSADLYAFACAIETKLKEKNT